MTVIIEEVIADTRPNNMPSPRDRIEKRNRSSAIPAVIMRHDLKRSLDLIARRKDRLSAE